jgi:general secretion pathway protein F
MPLYRYRAYDKSGALAEGEIETRSRELALQQLHQRGFHPLDVAEDKPKSTARWWDREVFGSGELPLSGLALLTRELATLVKAEIPLDDALRIVSLQPLIPARIRRVTKAVHEAVRGGESLAGALAARGAEFPEYYWRLVQAGESSSTLGDVLEDIGSFLERSNEMRSQVTSALVYPAVLLTAAMAALGVILTVLLTVMPLFKDAGKAPPAMLSFLVNAQAALAENWVLVLALLAAVALALALAWRSPALRLTIDRAILRLPVVGGLVAARETARFSRTLSTLSHNGVPMLDAVRISGSVLQNKAFNLAAAAAGESLKEGGSLSQPLAKSGLFSELALRLMAVGEQTAQLDTMLMRVAQIFESMLQRQLSRLMTLLTPFLTLLIGGMVGWLIISVMTAIMGINDIVSQ